MSLEMKVNGSTMTLRLDTLGSQSHASVGTARMIWHMEHGPQHHISRQSPIQPLVSVVSPTCS